VTGRNDFLHEMRGAGIDEGTLDRLLQGRILPDDAPPGYSEIASILVAAASPPAQEELRMQASHVVAARDAIGRRRRRFRAGPLGLATGLVLIGALLLLPGLAAAHVLPDSAQHGVTTVLQKIGITIPANTSHPTGPTAAPSTNHPASTGSDISSLARTTDATGVAKGAAISSLASGGKSQAGQHGAGASGGSPPVDTPNGGGTGTGDTASGGHADQGTAGADEHSGGHSSAGSGNASAVSHSHAG
jgi:hypothetical protein